MSFRLRGAGSNFLAGPPLWLPGARWPLAGVWRAGAVPSGVCGGLFWLVFQVRVSPAVVCRSVPRPVASCCGVLCFGVPCRGALHCGALRCVCRAASCCTVVGRWRAAWPVSWCGVRVRVWLAGDWGVRLGVCGSLSPCCRGLGMLLGLVGRVGVPGVALSGGALLFCTERRLLWLARQRGNALARQAFFRGGAGARNQVQSRAEYRCALLFSSALSQ